MAVQKSRKSRARRGMRRSHDRVWTPTLSTDPTTGESHYRHHMTATGFYKGRQVVDLTPVVEEDEEETAQG